MTKQILAFLFCFIRELNLYSPLQHFCTLSQFYTFPNSGALEMHCQLMIVVSAREKGGRRGKRRKGKEERERERERGGGREREGGRGREGGGERP
jgi:hypothetical protein